MNLYKTTDLFDMVNVKKLFVLVSLSCLFFAFNNCDSFEAIDLASNPGAQVPIANTLGKSQYSQNCAACHGSLELSAKKNADVSSIAAAIANVPQMGFLAQQSGLNLQAISEALNFDGRDPANDMAKFQCNAPTTRGRSNFANRRLTRFEIGQTVKDLFGTSVYDLSKSTIELYTNEVFVSSVNEFQPEIGQDQAQALISIALKVSDSVFAITANQNAVLPSCMTSSANLNLGDSSCNSNFVDSMGLKILRRPLTSAQKTNFLAMLTTTQNFHKTNHDRVKSMLASMMLTPEFTTHLAHITTASGDRALVDPYTVAQRISYLSKGSLPDSALFQAAASDQLKTDDQRMAHARRLLGQTASRAFVKDIFRLLLNTDYVSDPKANYGAYIGVSTTGLVNDLRKEALDFVEHIVFEQKGSFKDLVQSQAAFPPSANAAKLFGSAVSQGASDPKISTKGHRGLFMRPVLMIAPETRTSPIHRGVFFTRKVLCNEIPDPDPDSLTQGENLAGEIDPLTLTARQEAEHVTAAIGCQVCHKFINPAGSFLENLGPFGDFRTSEAIFNGNEFVRNLPIDTSIQNFILDGRPQNISGAADFNAKLASSTQAQACFVQNIYKYTRFKSEASQDNCHLSDVENLVRDDESIIEVMAKNASSEDQLWERIR